MDWFEKIKLMSRKELSEFLSEFDSDSITDDYCDNFCKEKNSEGCKHKNNCIISDANIIEKWLCTKSE